jgi:hypothetical protein
MCDRSGGLVGLAAQPAPLWWAWEARTEYRAWLRRVVKTENSPSASGCSWKHSACAYLNLSAIKGLSPIYNLQLLSKSEFQPQTPKPDSNRSIFNLGLVSKAIFHFRKTLKFYIIF